ncbi:Ribose operon repressor [Cellulomonas sp. T2.31MG-18]|uniref:LacI family DNA-binding transcriptional regulator n=1 Tax=Cellulomonas sp. T2.31MG-18 TaxID=3157619 RepID=UPI0035E4771C
MSDLAGRNGNRNRRATLKDVALASGLSQSTTSRALSGEGYVAEAARQRVLAAAEQLGYVPHAMARSLRKQVSRSVGVLVSDLRNPFYADLAAGIGAQARARGYTMMLVADQGLEEEQLSAAQAFVGTRAAGVIVTPLSAAVPQYLLSQQIPVVEVDRHFLPQACDSVTIDNETVARRITEHLLSLGHRSIGLLIDETAWTTGEARMAGYTHALEDAGLEVDRGLIIAAGSDVTAARAAVVDMLARRVRPTAMFAANNLLAEGLWRAAHALGLRIPEDLSIVSFDDAEWMSMVEPGITAIAQDAVALGEAAMDQLLDRIADPDAPPADIVLEARIVPRGSTAAPGGSH